MSLDVNEAIFKSTGRTAIEAFQKLQLPSGAIKTKAILTLTLGKLTSSKMFFAAEIRRLRISKVSMQIWAKRMEVTLK